MTLPSETAPVAVLVADKVPLSGLSALTEDDRFSVEVGPDLSEDDFERALQEAQALIVRSATMVTADLMDRAPRLRVVGRAGVGVDNIDLDEATARGIAVLNAPSGNTVSAAELTMALMLTVVRRIAAADRSVRAGDWKRSAFAGVELRGKTLGLVGAGRIGGEVARRARAFGMKILAYDPWLTDEQADKLGVRRCEFNALLEDADVITLHVPLTDSTRGLIDADALARMKPGAFLVNAARGGVVDEGAVAEALAKGTLAGAAFDVFEEEPIVDANPLRSAPNVVLTPHLGASTSEAQALVAEEIGGAVRSALVDGDLTRALNAPALGGEALRRLGPLLSLGKTIGRIAGYLAHGATERMEVRYGGTHSDAHGALTAHAAIGVLGVSLGERRLNVVNALHLARARGIEVATHTLARQGDYPEFVEVRLTTGGRSVSIAGALLGDRHPRLVRIDDYTVDVTPTGSLIVLRNRDVPGVIGRVGTVLGEVGLNIAEYHQSRRAEGGDALAAVVVDGDVSDEVRDRLAQLAEVESARALRLE